MLKSCFLLSFEEFCSAIADEKLKKTLRQTDKHRDRQTPNKVIPICRYASQATQQNSSLDMYYFGIYYSCWNNNFMSCTGICLSVFSLAPVNPISWSTISTSPLPKLLVSDWWTSTNFEPCILQIKMYIYMYATELKPCMNLCIYLEWHCAHLLKTMLFRHRVYDPEASMDASQFDLFQLRSQVTSAFSHFSPFLTLQARMPNYSAIWIYILHKKKTESFFRENSDLPKRVKQKFIPVAD